ncbi:MAG: bifunctional glutamate N-acetyltransferase/amino-acid acetyltransferase ArgJ [Thermoguttaceae bacterium]|nr:bifunctional glutamate N-acetyltransferase/amino-acid acetyltransferase ArgJ [Thermoguttaceae bacterium]MDW8079228.1 bifunctional glutamate N-acetyltransferase/amino-acid acetyltransferase ArgJ [Thermoguttaceae bacterium]
MDVAIPKGFRFAGVYCGLKKDPRKRDLALIVSDRPCAAAGVYTQNRIFAAPVAWDRAHTPSHSVRAVVINSGNANACTGRQGLEDAAEMARLTAAACGFAPDDVLVLSTGIIGEFLPMERIREGIRLASERLSADVDGFLAAADAMLTTDRFRKVASAEVVVGGVPIRLAGLAKGAGMISPQMATMLAVVVTDAGLGVSQADQLLRRAVDESFHCISVDGHMSTNDTVLLLANGASGKEVDQAADMELLSEKLVDVCQRLARAIPADGEGATHLITIDVCGCRTREDAMRIARTVANSPLVKTAVAGADPNWGRIVSAVGYSGVPFDPEKLMLHVNGYLLYQHGRPVPFDPEAVSQSIRQSPEVFIRISLEEGPAAARFWTSDLTVEYVHINADYHT